MSIYNELLAPLRCPHCDCEAEMCINLYFGNRDLRRYRIGDVYDWVEGRQPQKGGRPLNGSTIGEGYTECPCCHKDFFVDVEIHADVIVGVHVNADRHGYIP